MMGALKGWLLSVLAVSLFCALGEAVMPPGPVRKLGRLVCGLALLCGVLRPLTGKELDFALELSPEWSVAVQEETLRKQVGEGMRSVIEQSCEAYVLDRAAEQGFSVQQVKITCRQEESGLFIPDRALIIGSRSEALARMLQRELGIPADRQNYAAKEERA